MTKLTPKKLANKVQDTRNIGATMMIITIFVPFILLLIIFWFITHIVVVPLNKEFISLAKCQNHTMYMNLAYNPVDFLLHPIQQDDIWVIRKDIKDLKYTCIKRDMPLLNIKAICLWFNSSQDNKCIMEDWSVDITFNDKHYE